MQDSLEHISGLTSYHLLFVVIVTFLFIIFIYSTEQNIMSWNHNEQSHNPQGAIKYVH